MVGAVNTPALGHYEVTQRFDSYLLQALCSAQYSVLQTIAAPRRQVNGFCGKLASASLCVHVASHLSLDAARCVNEASADQQELASKILAHSNSSARAGNVRERARNPH